MKYLWIKQVEFLSFTQWNRTDMAEIVIYYNRFRCTEFLHVPKFQLRWSHMECLGMSRPSPHSDGLFTSRFDQRFQWLFVATHTVVETPVDHNSALLISFKFIIKLGKTQ